MRFRVAWTPSSVVADALQGGVDALVGVGLLGIGRAVVRHVGLELEGAEALMQGRFQLLTALVDRLGVLIVLDGLAQADQRLPDGGVQRRGLLLHRRVVLHFFPLVGQLLGRLGGVVVTVPMRLDHAVDLLGQGLDVARVVIQVLVEFLDMLADFAMGLGRGR